MRERGDNQYDRRKVSKAGVVSKASRTAIVPSPPFVGACDYETVWISCTTIPAQLGLSSVSSGVMIF
ncbi:hypothetical protein AKJ16_DCAP04870 [Drosera capensis]